MPNDVKNVDNSHERDNLSLDSGINSLHTIYVIAPDATLNPIGNNSRNESINKYAGIAINGCGTFDITLNNDAFHTFIPRDINNNDTAIPSGILCNANDITTNNPTLSRSLDAETPTLIYLFFFVFKSNKQYKIIQNKAK